MRYPLVRQNGYKSCGPCSLASIILYYKGYISVDELESMMHTSKEGTSAYNLITAAKKIGFESYGMRLDSIDNLKLPLIAHVTISNTYNHFIVIYKVLEDKVLIGDPASKVKYITKDEFYKIWNNVVIILNPLKKLPYVKPKSLFKFLKSELKNNIIRILYLLLISILSSFISLLYALYIKNLIDNMYFEILSFLSLFITNYFLIYYKTYLSINLNKKISISLTSDINQSLVLLPYIYYKRHKVGEVMSRYGDIDSIINFINDFISFITVIPMIILFLIFMYIESNILFKYNLVIIILYMGYGIISTYLIKKDIKVLKGEEAYRNSFLCEVLNAFETIKGLNIENKIIDKLNSNDSKLKATLCNTYKKYHIREIILDIIYNIGLLCIIFIGFSLYRKGYIYLSSLVTFYILYTNLSSPLLSLVNIFLSLKDASIKARRIQELFHPFTSQTIGDGNIEYRHASYKIGMKRIVNNVSLKIRKGDKVLLYGHNGSGKSSLVKMLKGYIKGNVYIDNTKIDNKIDNIIYVSKGDKIFEDTLINNLMSCDINKIKKLMKLCNLEKDLYTYIEEDGYNLSSGERAKIILIRALLKDFDILILDEALSEIDISSERKILKYIFNEFKDKTIIVIMHRFNNKDLFNHYIKLHNGVIKKERRRYA